MDKEFGICYLPNPLCSTEVKTGEHAHQNMETVFTDLDFSELLLASRDSPSNNNLGGKGGEEGRGKKFSIICHSSLPNYFQFQNEQKNYSSLLYNIVAHYLPKCSAAPGNLDS